jgi:HEAT repeat protein
VRADEPTIPETSEEALLRAGFGQGEDVASLIRTNLDSPVARHRVLALRSGVRQSLLSVDDWIAALDDDDLDVRREALNLWAQVDLTDDRIFASVMHALDDADALVVDGAVFALAEHLYVPAVDALSRIAREHDDARCRESAVAALGAIGDDRGRAAVLAALDDKPAVRRRAIVALTNFEGPDIDEALERARDDRDWQVRAAVDQLDRGDVD